MLLLKAFPTILTILISIFVNNSMQIFATIQWKKRLNDQLFTQGCEETKDKPTVWMLAAF